MHDWPGQVAALDFDIIIIIVCSICAAPARLASSCLHVMLTQRVMPPMPPISRRGTDHRRSLFRYEP